MHIAAAAYQTEIVRGLIAAGADVRARNRRGQEPLHYAAVGSPRSATWNPPAQAATIICLIEAGADPNAIDMDGVTPLHRAVRTRCAEAVRTLLAHGADPVRKNKSGSTPMRLAMHSRRLCGCWRSTTRTRGPASLRCLSESPRKTRPVISCAGTCFAIGWKLKIGEHDAD
jgi:ankyrin repeat protein